MEKYTSTHELVAPTQSVETAAIVATYTAKRTANFPLPKIDQTAIRVDAMVNKNNNPVFASCCSFSVTC